MSELANFLDMGGYAAFVWPSYAVTALVMIGLAALTLRGLRRNEAELRRVQDSLPRRRRDQGDGA